MFHNYKHDEKDPTCKYSFEIHDVDISFVNGIRRVMLTDIPTPGVIGEIEPTVEIIKNIGGLHNEIIAHRIGLIPICVSEELYDSIEDNDMQIELNVKNNGIKIMNVDSGQIKGTMKGNELTNSQLSSLFPKNKITDSHVLITRLRSNEELHFKANIVKKTARYNSAFSPVSLANFFYIQNESNFKKDMSILDKERTYHKNKFGEATRVQFEIEPINFNISAKFLVNRCLDILIQKFKNISDNLFSDNKNILISQCDELSNTFQFVIMNEDDTIGNILQSFIHNKYIRNKSSFNDIICSYIGYICPHPLKEELIIKLTLDDQSDINKFIMFMDSHCKIIIDELSIIKNEWNKFIDNK